MYLLHIKGYKIMLQSLTLNELIRLEFIALYVLLLSKELYKELETYPRTFHHFRLSVWYHIVEKDRLISPHKLIVLSNRINN